MCKVSERQLSQRAVGQAEEARTEVIAAGPAVVEEVVRLHRLEQPVGRGPRISGGVGDLRQATGIPCLDGVQDRDHAVEHTHAAADIGCRSRWSCYAHVSHIGTTSQYLGQHPGAPKGEPPDAADARREGLGTPRRPSRRRRARPPVRGPASGPRGHQPAGVRRPAAAREARPSSGPHRRDHGPQRADDDRSRHRRDLQATDGCVVRERGGVRHHALPDGVAGPGDRPRDRARAGLHAARSDDRLRRLAHLHARRVRRPRDRHRDIGGRARPGDPDAPADETRHHGGVGRGGAPGRGRGEGRDPGDHRAHRDERGRRSHRGVPRVGDPRALDGGTHDHLQHVDRGRRARGHGRAGRHHVRLRGGPPSRAPRCRLGARARRLANAADGGRRDVRHGGR